MKFLNKVLEHKIKEVDKRKLSLPLDDIKKIALETKWERRPFLQIFQNGRGIICEIKPRSPSKGQLIFGDIETVAKTYAGSTADAISVLTDSEFFGGGLENLKTVRDIAPQPILQKDFIIDEYQIYESLLYGADAFLLIVAALTKEKLKDLLQLGLSLNLGVLVEVHTQEELDIAMSVGAPLIGINNRDLESLEVHLERTEELSSNVPKNIPFISESGIYSAQDVVRVRKVGAKGILVGTSILESTNPVELISELKSELNK